MRPILLALAILASTPVDAAACHRFSVWRYPWPQACHLASRFIPEKLPNFGTGREKAAIQLPPEPDIPLPSLARADLDGGEADEPTRAHVLLRAALEAANGH